VAIKHVFSHPDVEQLELQGYRVISGFWIFISRC
jgi:dGTPase